MFATISWCPTLDAAVKKIQQLLSEHLRSVLVWLCSLLTKTNPQFCSALFIFEMSFTSKVIPAPKMLDSTRRIFSVKRHCVLTDASMRAVIASTVRSQVLGKFLVALLVALAFREVQSADLELARGHSSRSVCPASSRVDCSGRRSSPHPPPVDHRCHREASEQNRNTRFPATQN